jgi:hypothetical protein
VLVGGVVVVLAELAPVGGAELVLADGVGRPQSDVGPQKSKVTDCDGDALARIPSPSVWHVAESAFGQLMSPKNSRAPLVGDVPVPVHPTPTRQAASLLVALNWEPTHGGGCSSAGAAAQPAVVKSVIVNGEAATTLVTVTVIPAGICPSQSASTHSAVSLSFSASGVVVPIGNPARDIETPPPLPPPSPADCGDSGPEPSIDGVAVKPILGELEFVPALVACPLQPTSSRTNRPASWLKHRIRGGLKVTPHKTIG